MIEALLSALIYVCILALVIWVILWVLQSVVGVSLPQTVVKIVWIIFVLVVCLYLLKLFPGVTSGHLTLR